MQTLKALHAFSSLEGNFAKDDEFEATEPRATLLIEGGYAEKVELPAPLNQTFSKK